MFFRTNRRSIKYAPKEFSKVNACAQDPPWCYKKTQFSWQHRSVTPTRSNTYNLFSQRRLVRLIFKQRSYITISSWIKLISTLMPELAFTEVTWYTNRCIHFYISAPNQEINFFIFYSTIVNIFGGFPSKFSKCCFHSFILSCWFAAFSFALAVFFLLLTSFIVCQAILDCLSSTESLILSIWFWMYSVCSFIYTPAN